MFIENPSKYGYTKTIDTLSQTIAGKGWKVLVSHDLKEILDKKGYSVLPVTVIELCNPAYSSRLLMTDAERLVATMMPCRVAVYEKSDGMTYVSRMNAEAFAKMMGGVVEEVMTGAFRDMETMIESVL